MKLRLERVAIGKLVLAQSDTEREIGPLTMDVHAGAKALTVAVEPAQTPWGSVALHADIANEAPFVLHGNVDWKREGDRPITGRLEASGELARIDLRSSIRAQSSAIEANAIVQPFSHPVIERAQAQLHAVDLRHFTEGTLAAVWDGTLDVAADGPIVHGKMAVTNNMPGAVDEGRVPLGTVAAAVQYADGGWDYRSGLESVFLRLFRHRWRHDHLLDAVFDQPAVLDQFSIGRMAAEPGQPPR